MRSNVQINQAIFQEALLNVAYQKAAIHNTPLGYDLRGRVIFDLRLDENDLRLLLEKITEKAYTHVASFDELKLQLSALIGIEITDIIRCNLDLDDLTERTHLQQALQTISEKSPLSLLSLENINQRMSIIPLYEEFLNNIEHHQAVVRQHLTRVYKSRGGLPTAVNNALNDAFDSIKLNLQRQVNLIAEGLNQAWSIKKINKKLDKARSVLHKQLKADWFTRFKTSIQALGIDDKSLIFSALATRSFKQCYKEMPAHQYSILGSDFVNNTVTFITDSSWLTAHNKHKWHLFKPGASAFRMLLRNHLSSKGKVSARPGGQLSARVPSVANIEEKSLAADISQINAIFAQCHEDFDKISHLKSEPIVYNLLTSLDSYAEEHRDRKNKQNKSTRRILAGAHWYNKAAKERGHVGKYLWVQNLSVNRHSEDLNDTLSLNVHKEVKIMADIALLYTLQYNLNHDYLKQKYTDVLGLYNEFLDQSQLVDFHASEQGKKVAKLIRDCKTAHLGLQLEPQASLVHKVNLALLKMFQLNEYYDEKNGNLVQSLSVFVENKSIVGCKSATERHEDIQKRVGYLIGCEAQQNQLPPKLDNTLNVYLTEAKGKVSHLASALAREVNEKRMYGDECSISHSDQAASSKLQILAGLFGRGLWLFGKISVSLGLVVSVALVIVILGFLGSGLGIVSVTTALIISASVFGLGLLSGLTGAFVFKAKDTNHACAPEMNNNVNAHAASMQSGHGAQDTLRAARQEFCLLHPIPVPWHWKAALALCGLGGIGTAGLGVGLAFAVSLPTLGLPIAAWFAMTIGIAVLPLTISGLIRRGSRLKIKDPCQSDHFNRSTENLSQLGRGTGERPNDYSSQYDRYYEPVISAYHRAIPSPKRLAPEESVEEYKHDGAFSGV